MANQLTHQNPQFEGRGGCAKRIVRLDKAILDQRAFLHRVPDPDTRERAERHLYKLMAMRDHVLRAAAQGSAS